MDYYPSRAIRSGTHDPTFGGEIGELLIALALASLAGWLLAQPASLLLSWTALASGFVIYCAVLTFWSLISMLVRKRPGWGLLMIGAGIGGPLLSLLAMSALNAPTFASPG